MPQQPNLNKMLKQVQEMQAEMMKAQEQLKDEIIEASAGGGMVTVKATGGGEIVGITIDPKAIDPDDPEMLSDLILAAVNEALRSANALMESKMQGMLPGGLGGLGLPGFYASLLPTPRRRAGRGTAAAPCGASPRGGRARSSRAGGSARG
jgi:nucleoid-associated protein EbfC